MSLLSGILGAFSAWAAPQEDSTSKASVPANPAMSLVIVAPPGVNFGSESERYARELARLVEKSASLPEGTISARAFDDPEKASAAILESSGGCAVLGSLSFYIARKDTLGLTPFLALRRQGTDQSRALTDQYRVVVKKGRFQSLRDLKGLTLVGTPLSESQDFLARALFSGSGLSPRDFHLKTTQRPLREIRKLADESRDAVVVDEAQFLSLSALSTFADVEVIYASRPVPSLGVMLREGRHTKTLAPAFKDAVKNLCDLKDAAPLCQSFGIDGFADVDEAAVNAFVASMAN